MDTEDIGTSSVEIDRITGRDLNRNRRFQPFLSLSVRVHPCPGSLQEVFSIRRTHEVNRIVT
jgi:hypothetical protein